MPPYRMLGLTMPRQRHRVALSFANVSDVSLFLALDNSRRYILCRVISRESPRYIRSLLLFWVCKETFVCKQSNTPPLSCAECKHMRTYWDSAMFKGGIHFAFKFPSHNNNEEASKQAKEKQHVGGIGGVELRRHRRTDVPKWILGEYCCSGGSGSCSEHKRESSVELKKVGEDTKAPADLLTMSRMLRLCMCS